jgi:hypothetical protein
MLIKALTINYFWLKFVKVKVEDTHALRFILQDELYLLDEDKSLYSGTPITQPEIQTQQPVFNYLGSNKKNFLVLVSYDEHEFMQDEHLAALESVLGRMGYTRDDVAILNLPKAGSAIQEDIVAYFEPKTMVVLGKNAIPAGTVNLKFNGIEVSGNTKVLYTFSFDEMMTDVANKKVFWEQVKNL